MSPICSVIIAMVWFEVLGAVFFGGVEENLK